MSNFEDDDDLTFSYGDIGRTTFMTRRPGKEKTFEDDFRWRLYQQEKIAIQAEGTRRSLFNPDLIQAALTILHANTKLQNTANAAAFVLGLEYYQYVLSQQPPEQLKQILLKGLKCSHSSKGLESSRRIQPYDIIRYARLIWTLFQGDNTLQSTTTRFKQIKTDDKDIDLIVSTSDTPCPSFQTEIPSKDPPTEGQYTVIDEELPGQIKSRSLPIYKFDTIDSLLDRYCLQRPDPLPREYIQHTIKYNDSLTISSGVKTFELPNKQIIAVQIEEEKSSLQNSLDGCTIRIHPITQVTTDETLTLAQTLSKLQQKFIDPSLSVAYVSAYFICFGLISSTQLFQPKVYSNETIWKAVARNHLTPGTIESEMIIEVNGKVPQRDLLRTRKNLLQQQILTPEITNELSQINRQLDILQSKILTFTLFSSIRDLIADQFAQLQNRVQRHTISARQMTYLLSLPDTFRVTSMKETNYTLEGTFRLEGYDTYQIFDDMNVSFEIPFCSVGKFHKVLNDIVLPKEWLHDQDTEDIIFYIRTNVSKGLYSITPSNIIDPSIYTKVFLSFDKSELVQISNKETYISTFRVTIEAAYSVELDEVLQRFLMSFQSPPLDLSVRKLFGKGEYVVAGFTFSEEIFQDYVFNDPVVREFASINEKFVIYKERGGIKFKLGAELEGSLHYNLIEKTTDPEAKMFPGEINVGDTVYRITIIREARSGNISIKDVLNRKQYFDKCLLYIFNTHVSRFYSWYCRHLSNIQDLFYVKEVKRKQKIYHKDPKTRLQELNPLLFRTGYTSKGGCEIGKLPEIISEEEATQTKYKLKFPKDADVTDERPQFWYTCPMGNYQYPTLKINQIKIKKNKKEEEAFHKLYPFIPCCSEQKGLKDSIVYSYEEDPNNTLDNPIVPGQKDARSSKTILLDKMPIGLRRMAYLPKTIQDLLTINLESTLLGEQTFVRLGVPFSKLGNSFLSACCMALVYQSRLKDSELASALKEKEDEYKNKLISLLPRNLHSQNEKSADEMISILQTEQFMNPRDWIDILQIVLEMNIVVFYHESDSMHPIQYERFFLLRQSSLFPYSKTIYLYNTPSKRAYEHRHTELIVLVSSPGSKILQTSFAVNPNGPLSLQQAITNTRHSKDLPSSKYCKVVYQLPDAYGKIRELLFELHSKSIPLSFKDSKAPYYIKLFCSPIAPLPLLSIVDIKTTITTQDPFLLYELMKLLQFKISLILDVSKSHIIGLAGQTDYIHYYGLFDKPIPKDRIAPKKLANLLQELDVYSVETIGYPFPINDIKSQDTFFQKYSLFSRQANCLLNYAYYLFSYLYHDKSQDLLEFLPDFETNHMIIKENHSYSVDTRSFQMENSFITDQKLIVTSLSLQERILYNLRLQLEYNEFTIHKYYLQKYVQNYYNNAKDFTSRNEFTIYFTIQEYINSREKQKMVYHVYSSPVEATAYYFQHPTVFDGILCVATRLRNDQEVKQVFGTGKPLWHFTGTKKLAIQFKQESFGLQMNTTSSLPEETTPLLLLYIQDNHQVLYYQVTPIASLPSFNFLKDSI